MKHLLGTAFVIVLIILIAIGLTAEGHRPSMKWSRIPRSINHRRDSNRRSRGLAVTSLAAIQAAAIKQVQLASQLRPAGTGSPPGPAGAHRPHHRTHDPSPIAGRRPCLRHVQA